MPERYGDSDTTIITVTMGTGAQVVIFSGKVASTNPFELGHAADGGMDLRQGRTTAYAYDGISTMTEYLPDGQTNIYQGENGTPSALMPHLRSIAGMPVGSESFTQ